MLEIKIFIKIFRAPDALYTPIFIAYNILVSEVVECCFLEIVTFSFSTYATCMLLCRIKDQYFTTFNSSKMSEPCSFSTTSSAFSAPLIGFPQIYSCVNQS
jgi:hypothetical protein